MARKKGGRKGGGRKGGGNRGKAKGKAQARKNNAPKPKAKAAPKPAPRTSNRGGGGGGSRGGSRGGGGGSRGPSGSSSSRTGGGNRTSTSSGKSSGSSNKGGGSSRTTLSRKSLGNTITRKEATALRKSGVSQKDINRFAKKNDVRITSKSQQALDKANAQKGKGTGLRSMDFGNKFTRSDYNKAKDAGFSDKKISRFATGSFKGKVGGNAIPGQKASTAPGMPTRPDGYKPGGGSLFGGIKGNEKPLAGMPGDNYVHDEDFDYQGLMDEQAAYYEDQLAQFQDQFAQFQNQDFNAYGGGGGAGLRAFDAAGAMAQIQAQNSGFFQGKARATGMFAGNRDFTGGGKSGKLPSM